LVVMMAAAPRMYARIPFDASVLLRAFYRLLILLVSQFELLPAV
jgi:hypothetical protein